MNHTPDFSEAELHARLIAIVQQSDWLMSALRAARGLGLASWCIGAGAIRNLVWDTLFEFETTAPGTDIDLAYFDATDLRPERDCELQTDLFRASPQLSWEVTNQAAVHLWYENFFGQKVGPLASLEDGIASWPEFATAIGITLQKGDSIRVIAPHGLHDLFAGIVRRNPIRLSSDEYRARLAKKQFQKRWPRLRVVIGESES